MWLTSISRPGNCCDRSWMARRSVRRAGTCNRFTLSANESSGTSSMTTTPICRAKLSKPLGGLRTTSSPGSKRSSGSISRCRVAPFGAARSFFLEVVAPDPIDGVSDSPLSIFTVLLFLSSTRMVVCADGGSPHGPSVAPTRKAQTIPRMAARAVISVSRPPPQAARSRTYHKAGARRARLTQYGVPSVKTLRCPRAGHRAR